MRVSAEYLFYAVCLMSVRGSAEISFQHTLKAFAVTGFVMNVTEKPSNINTFFKNPTWLDTIFVL